MKLLWKYCVPIIFFLVGLSTLLGEPTEPANRYLPVALGEYQLIVSAALFLLAVALAAAIRRYEINVSKHRSDGSARESESNR